MANDCISMTDEVRSGNSPSNERVAPRRVLGGMTATLLVVASMVGTGVFTTSGVLLTGISSPMAVLVGWVIGGLIALFGALSYAELVAAMPNNGGEYQLLSRIFHPSVGFVAGWVSLVVGFSAPIAAAAIAFGEYSSAVLPGLNKTALALGLILVLSIMHGMRVTLGSSIQNVFTAAKLVVVVLFIGGGLLFASPSRLVDESHTSIFSSMISPGFAIGLIFISFAYSGWNGAAYIAGEIKNPKRSLPKALALGTALVTALYLGLNLVFLSAAPVSELAGSIDIGKVAAVSLFGEEAGRILSGVISLLLVSSVSAMIMAGPRVYQAIGEDYGHFKFLRLRSTANGPAAAVGLQAAAAIVMLLTSSFDSLLLYIGFTLSLSAGLTVAGVFVLRKREPNLERPYRSWGYPVTPLLFIGLSCWMVVFTLIEVPMAALAGGGTIAAGFVLWLLTRASYQPKAKES